MFEHIFRLRSLNTDFKTGKRMSVTRLGINTSNTLRILYHYAKNRTQTYMYVAPAVISMLIANGKIEPFGLATVAISTYFASLAAYIYNDVYDIKIDRINSADRPLVSSKATRKDLLVLSTILNLAAIVTISTTNILATLFLITFISLGILYSHPRTSLKDTFPFKTIIAGTGGAISSLVGSLTVGIPPTYVIYVAAVTFASFFILASLGDIGDLRGDREAKRRTFPIVIGMRPTIVMMSLTSLLIAFVTVLIYELLDMNSLGLFLIAGTSIAMMLVLRSLTNNLEERNLVMKTRYKMRILHLLLQVSMLIGAISIVY